MFVRKVRKGYWLLHLWSLLFPKTLDSIWLSANVIYKQILGLFKNWSKCYIKYERNNQIAECIFHEMAYLTSAYVQFERWVVAYFTTKCLVTDIFLLHFYSIIFIFISFAKIAIVIIAINLYWILCMKGLHSVFKIDPFVLFGASIFSLASYEIRNIVSMLWISSYISFKLPIAKPQLHF